MIDYIWWSQVSFDIVYHIDSLLLDDVRFTIIFYLFFLKINAHV